MRKATLSLAVFLALVSLLTWVLIAGGVTSAAAALTTCPTDLLISEYVEGSSNNKALEVFNGTGAPLNLAGYKLTLYSNGNTSPGNDYDLSGTLAPGDVFVIAHSDAHADILAVADDTDDVTFFNGNDAIVLTYNGTVVDSMGRVGDDSYWGSEVTLVRKSSIMAGDTTTNDTFDPAGEWDSYAQNTFTYLGSHTLDPCGTAAYFALTKSAPAEVDVGQVFTYSLVATNYISDTATGVVISDALPLNLEIGAISDGGVSLGDNVVRWTISSLANGDSVTRTVAVTAPSSVTMLANDDYAVWASNWLTKSTGSAVQTLVVDPGGIVPIHVIQGSGATSPMNEATDVIIEGVVVGDFQNTTNELGGFFVQEEDADVDANEATSEGIFVYDSGFGVDVNVGDLVRVQGDVSEYYGLTELKYVDSVVVSDSGMTVTKATVDLPVSAIDDLERYEGMLITFPKVLYATETYDLGRYGEVWVSANDRLFNPTNVVTPGLEANTLQALNDRSRLLIDDGSTVQNPPTVPHLAPDNTLRLGDTITGLTGVLSYDFNFYRLQPTAPLAFMRANARTTAPEAVSGTLKVASFNVLNYFNGDGLGGGFPTSRGADTLAEFNRQRTKIVSATRAIDADVIGLMEIENDGYGVNSAIQDLVNGLNDATAPGTYAFIDPGVTKIGSDEIAVGLIYKPSTVTPIGAAAILDSSVDPTFHDEKNRPALAQTFEEKATGEMLTVVVNHLKSKGSDCNALGDPDTGDGQGNCNLTRKNAAIALTNWLASDPTGSGDPDSLIIGDLNAYAMEDPITAIKDAGYTDLVDHFGTKAYSYVFEGQAGYLDHALANASLMPQVKRTTIWHINADEPRILDYNQEYNPPALYSPDAYRASDHDPVVVTFSLGEKYTLYLPLVAKQQ